MNFYVSTVDAMKNLIPVVLLIAEHNVLHAHGSAEVGKKLPQKIPSRSPLMKELSRLGFAETLPDFMSKDLRRRRNMANVQVLFSQSLNDDIRRQQKKVFHLLVNLFIFNFLFLGSIFFISLIFRSWHD